MLKAVLRTAAVAGALAAAAMVAFPVFVGPDRPSPATGSPALPRATPPPRSFASPRIPPGAPEWITIPAIGVDATVQGVVSTHEQGLWVLIPPMATNTDLQRVYWWSEHAAPADPSNGTTYIYGHACSHYAQCAFNRLHELAIGDLVGVTTVRGALTYRVVVRPIRLAKTADGIGDSSVYDYGVGNRLVLITCGYAADGASPWNWVVIAQLTAATTAP